MKLYLLVVFFLVVAANAKDLQKLKRLGSLKSLKSQQKQQKHKEGHEEHHKQAMKISTVTCILAEDPDSDPRTSSSGKIIMESAPVTSTAPDAVTKFQEWEASTEAGVWPHIDKGSLIGSVKVRLDNPTRVNQGSAPTCGPASIIFWLLVRRPYTYIQMMRELYETGEYTDDITQFKVTASDKHKTAEVGHNMDPADWIALIALRTSANLILDLDQFGGAWGPTTPGEMTTWTKNILSYANAANSGLLNGDQADTLRRAEAIVNGNTPDGSPNEGVASLLVDASVVQGSDTVIDIPNHWIAYVSSLVIDTTQVKFRAFTWGKLCDVTVPKSEWDSKGWGVVTGGSPDTPAN